MKEKLYQLKEIMEMFGITRDTIKYYEKRGLIKPSREENGYRLFDALNIEKLKRSLDLRDLGFSIEEVIEIGGLTLQEKGIEMTTTLRKDTEQKMRELSQKLEKIRAYESGFLETQRYTEGFNVEHDFSICVDCPLLTDRDKKTFYVRCFKILHLDEEYRLMRTEYKFGVKGNPELKEECFNCKRERKVYRSVYRRLIVDEGKEKLEQTLKKAFREGSLLGYELMREIYISKRILMNGEVDKIFLDVRIPIKEEKYNA